MDALRAFFFGDETEDSFRMKQYIDSYWKQFEKTPNTPEGRLADLFLTYFSCPVSETSCERIFRVMREILTDERQSISMENLFCTLQLKLAMQKKNKH